MNATAPADEVADLRHRRRELRRELARVRWWRRLVTARRDLTLAALAEPDGLAQDSTDMALDALVADAPTERELAGAVWPDGVASTSGDLAALDALGARLDRYEGVLGETLDTVTARMVDAMGRAHRADSDPREREHA